MSSQVRYQNQWISVREDQIIRPDGSTGVYGVVDTPPSVFIIALTDEAKVLFVKLFRYPIQQEALEIPAGGSDGGDPLLAAQRELAEETGYSAQKWQAAGSFYPNNGLTSQISYVFIATELEALGSDEMQHEGITEVLAYSWDEIDIFMKNGAITDGQVIAALTLARLQLVQK